MLINTYTVISVAIQWDIQISLPIPRVVDKHTMIHKMYKYCSFCKVHCISHKKELEMELIDSRDTHTHKLFLSSQTEISRSVLLQFIIHIPIIAHTVSQR